MGWIATMTSGRKKVQREAVEFSPSKIILDPEAARRLDMVTQEAAEI